MNLIAIHETCSSALTTEFSTLAVREDSLYIVINYLGTSFICGVCTAVLLYGTSFAGRDSIQIIRTAQRCTVICLM